MVRNLVFYELVTIGLVYFFEVGYFKEVILFVVLYCVKGLECELIFLF